MAVASLPAHAQASAARPAPRVVTDEAGRRVTIPPEVNRIVSLAPDLTETMYALGLQGRLVGDTDYCDTPAEAKIKPHVGGPMNPSIEAIVALHPDLVLASESINWERTADAIARLGIPVYTTNPHTVRGMVDSFGRLADLLGASQQGAALVARLNNRLENLHARLADLPPAHVLFVVWLEPLTTIGQNTFIADALRWAGAESIVLSKQNWPQLSLEEVVRLQPDYIVLADSHSGEGTRTLDDLRAREAWKDLRAVQERHVAIVSEEIDRPAPGLIDAIEELAHQIHPNAFAAKDNRMVPGANESRRSAACVR
ncbi:MAG TPA: ABC transporter substrate-binding protein [Candidatus Acidoferrum sp.]|nr:ABC transporter substrate-binding protein [Candidatus Acidoferrum sp.]